MDNCIISKEYINLYAKDENALEYLNQVFDEHNKMCIKEDCKDKKNKFKTHNNFSFIIDKQSKQLVKSDSIKIKFDKCEKKTDRINCCKQFDKCYFRTNG